MLGSFAVGAMMIGSLFGGRLIAFGRHRVLTIAAYIGIIGVGITLILDIKIILTGRILYGISTGLIAVAMPRYMDEVLPPSLISLYGGLYCFSFAIATIIAYMLALGLPDDKHPDGTDNIDGLTDDKFWRIIFGLPILLYVVQLILMYTACRYESPKFLLLKIEALQKLNGSESHVKKLE